MTPPEGTLAPEQIIAAAAAWMDRCYPGWHESINTDTLDLMNSELCIGGQSGHHWDHELTVGIEADLGWNDGGNVFSDNVAYKDLWIAEIESRREPVLV